MMETEYTSPWTYSISKKRYGYKITWKMIQFCTWIQIKIKEQCFYCCSTSRSLMSTKWHRHWEWHLCLCLALNVEFKSCLCDKVCRWLGEVRWFSPGTPISSTTNKTDRKDITEILLKVALNTITPIISIHIRFIIYISLVRDNHL